MLMINQKRRQLITTACIITATNSFPSLTAAACPNKDPEDNNGLEVSLKQLNSTTQTVTITNKTYEVIELKHVYPGIVHSNGRVFDLNSLLARESITVKPGHSVSLSMNAAESPLIEAQIPRELKQSRPIAVSTYYAANSRVRSVTTLRNYFV